MAHQWGTSTTILTSVDYNPHKFQFTALNNTIKSISMKTYFDRIVSATGKNYYIERSISGYYRLMLDGEPVFDDSAAEELNEDRETAEAFFGYYLLGYVVPEDKKTIKNGIITLL